MARRSPLFTPAWELATLGLLLAIYLIGDWLIGSASVEFLNIVGPVCLTVILWTGALRMILLDDAAIWTSLFWFRVSTGVYFGVGALVPLLMSDAVRIYLESFFLFHGDHIAKVNLIVVVACIAVLGTANVVFAIAGDGARKHRRAEEARTNSGGAQTLAAGLLFLVIGGIVKYLYVVPYALGLTDFVLPGSVGPIGNFTYAALFFLTIWSRAHSKAAFPFVVAFVLLEMGIGVLSLSKTDVLTPLIIFLCALVRLQLTVWRLGMVVAALIVCYLSIVPIVEYGRAEHWRRYQSLGGADLMERLQILALSLDHLGNVDETNSVESLLVRISYVNQATFAVNLYDSGRAGDTLSRALVVFIPRLLWPDKPVTTQVAIEFNLAATGISTSASSPGLFAEAYWNYGWTGVILLTMTLGLLLAFLSRYALGVFHREKWLYFPVVILAMRIGFRTDGYYVPDVIGALVILIALHLVLYLFDRFTSTLLQRPVVRRV
jgi:hypothetical protein